jgi:sodium-dependent dicarboxylate transporter 2/3/5
MMIQSNQNANKPVPKILLIDDEDRFRNALGRQLKVRGFKVLDTDSGESAIKIVRHENPEVVILDQNMPDMDGIQTLRELKKIRPEVQIIICTGYGSTEAARLTGKYDVFSYLEKPSSIDEIVETINAARKERTYALAKHEIPEIQKTGFMSWLVGAPNARPGLIALAIALFFIIAYMPTPNSLNDLLTYAKEGVIGEKVEGYSEYRKMKKGDTISAYYPAYAKLYEKKAANLKDNEKKLIPASKVAFRAKVMIGILVVAALFWATAAIPVGITALLVGALMIFFNILSPGDVAKSYAKDSVIFIFGVLAIAAAISKTGLDRRIGLLLLGTSTSLVKFSLIFGPMLAVTASFLSEHALVAFIAPILMIVYLGAVKTAKVAKDKHLIIMLMLMLTFCGNVGGPGSPAAGGRNAVMLGILADYDVQLTFGKWVLLGLPFVPVMAIVIALYFFFVLRNRISIKDLNIANEVRKEAGRIGKMTPDEYKAAAILLLLIILWSFFSDQFGMGGPVLLCLVLLNVTGVLRWKDVNSIHWDVVALYAAASAMGVGLAATGAALWLASGFLAILPDAFTTGTGLCVSSSLLTGILTNFMSDGATVAVVGPITVPMATLSGSSAIAVGLATAFSSSFAHVLIIGTPNNAIVYSMAKDPETGEQLLTMKDFFLHGIVVLVLSLLILWVWTFLGYWQWLGVL